ncbi:NAD(P)-dependent oxidoreductase [Aestuariicoccus sp. MJ-SS9]|uniref:NAD-dependent epimerase/dehydratase family protein n=1 Tax=Aestuariicoccus sp. MJ-SS9 TaxID=3079855 RepID=UPI00290A8C01|nr:NAD(P)-dependent oxidoreductase [Aestuariicoccus sp. MJ-SS9]MDU8910818.1 NAD(P)-dependent oxidoreductase [Aestuariicoccus sp. MJ-SS9]
MGAVSRILITGAAGFVGRACVAEARRRGLKVTAVIRGPEPAEWVGDAGIAVLKADLADTACRDHLGEAVAGADAIIHAAAHLGDQSTRHGADTVGATENLLAVRGAARLVLVSSITVYDTMRLSPGDALTEESPLEDPDHARDPYTAAKLRQEALCRASGAPLWILRPGAIYGPGRTWHALGGVSAGPLHVAITSDGELPLCHVDHVAQAHLTAACTDPGGIRALNVIDDDLPTRGQFLAAHRRITGWPGLSVPIPYPVWLTLARLLKPLGDRLPGLLREPVLRARLMPLRYPNVALRAALGGGDTAPFEELLERAVREGGT